VQNGPTTRGSPSSAVPSSAVPSSAVPSSAVPSAYQKKFIGASNRASSVNIGTCFSPSPFRLRATTRNPSSNRTLPASGSLLHCVATMKQGKVHRNSDFVMVVESSLKIENAAEQDELPALEGAEMVELGGRRAVQKLHKTEGRGRSSRLEIMHDFQDRRRRK
jgi:hypothetical protein